MQQPDKQREAFEAWYGENYSQYALKTWREWKYDNLDTELAWQAWQAAQQALQAPLRMVDPVSQAMGLINDWNEGVADDEEWGNEACQTMFALSDCIKTLLIEAGAQQQWMPIETAPKDGTKVLLLTRNGVVEGFYTSFVTGYGYWQQRVAFGMGEYGDIKSPSHWLPLPQGPNVVD